MLRNYFLVAYRTLLRYKAYTALNVLGLSLGLTCGILIFQVLKFQLSYDGYHRDKDRIYRVMTDFYSDGIGHSGGVPAPMGKALRNDFAFLEKVGMIFDQYNLLVTVPDEKGRAVKKFNEDQIISYAEPEFFEILDYHWVAGNARLSLTQPNTAVVTRKLAEKYFGHADPIGKRLRINNNLDVKITGVLGDIPDNTDRRSELFLSWATLKNYSGAGGAGLDNWGGVNSSTHCFVRLREGTSMATVEKAMTGFVKKYHPEEPREWGHPFISLTDIHFATEYDGQMGKRQLYALGVIGLFLILTACINFVNLATAQALKRSREVGVRKVIGGTKSQLFWQFISETGLITVLSVILAVLLAEITLPSVNHWVQETAGINLFGNLRLLSDGQMAAFLVVLLLLVTFFAGSYPGLVLAGFQPVAALKGKISTQQVGGMSIRRSLVVVQFVLTQILIIGSIVVTQQMDFFRGKDLGYDPTAVVLVDLPTTDKATETLRHRFLQVPGVEKVSFSSYAPTSQSNNNTNHRFDSRQEDEKWSVNTKPADSHYLEAYGLKLVAGKNIAETDTTRGFLVNETYVRRLGGNVKPADVVGRMLSVWDRKYPILGVIKDWNNLSLHNDIQAIAVFADRQRYHTAGLKINRARLTEALAGIERIWNETYPDHLYDRTFLDERIASSYHTENLILQLIRAFSGIAIVIGCLGLYGLVSFMAAQKTKEIGVRKVLGATVPQILALFGREFGKLILLAFFVAAPAGWWVMTHWLEDYTFRIAIGWSVFALAIVVTTFIAAVTVGWQSFRAATANPANSLKSE